MSAERGQAPSIDHLEVRDLRHLIDGSRDGIVIVDDERRVVYVNPAMQAKSGYSEDELVGRDLLEMIPEALHDEMIARMRDGLQGDTGRRSSAILRADGAVRDVEYSSMLLEVHGRPHIAAIVRDVTERRRLERESRALLSIAGTLTSDRTLDERLDIVTRIAVESTGAEACTVVVMSGEPPVMQRLRGHGLPPGFAETMIAVWEDVRDSDVAAIRAFRTRETQIVPSIKALVRDRPLAPAHDRLYELVDWEYSVATPIVFRDAAVGTMLSYYARGARPDEEEIRLLRAIANQAAVAIENVRLFQESRRSAILDERQRLARELHDSVSQALYGIILGARTARTMLERDPTRVAEPLDYVLSLAEDGLSEMRALIFELRPDALEREGLTSTLRAHAAGWQARYGVEIDADLPPEPDLSPAIKEALYRIIQEASRNAIKHAAPSRIDIRIRVEPETVIATVSDDGTGFDASRAFPGHFGLRSMQERAASAGGRLDIDSEPGRGTSVVARLPRRSPRERRS